MAILFHYLSRIERSLIDISLIDDSIDSQVPVLRITGPRDRTKDCFRIECHNHSGEQTLQLAIVCGS